MKNKYGEKTTHAGFTNINLMMESRGFDKFGRPVFTPAYSAPSRSIYITRRQPGDGFRVPNYGNTTKGAFASVRLKPMAINKRAARILSFKRVHGII